MKENPDYADMVELRCCGFRDESATCQEYLGEQGLKTRVVAHEGHTGRRLSLGFQGRAAPTAPAPPAALVPDIFFCIENRRIISRTEEQIENRRSDIENRKGF